MIKEVLRMHNVRTKQTSFPLACINLVLYENEILGVSGLNDCSYMCLPDVLSGEVPVESGYYSNNRSHGIYVISSMDSLSENMSIAESLFVVNDVKGAGVFVRWQKIKRETALLLQQIGLFAKPEQRVKELSRAEKLIIIILKAVCQGFEVVLLDHVFSLYSYEEIAAIKNCLHLLAQWRSCSFIMVSGQLDYLKLLCGRIYLVSAGNTVFCLDKEQFGARHLLASSGKAIGRQDYQHDETDGKRPELIICGQISPETNPFVMTVEYGALVSVLDMSNSACWHLADNITLNHAGDHEWKQLECSLNGVPVTKNEMNRIVRFSEASFQAFFDNFSFDDNLTINALEKISVCNGLFISYNMQAYFCRQYFEYLKRLQIPYTLESKPSINLLTYEQKIFTAFYKMLIMHPDFLIIDNPSFSQQRPLSDLIFDIIELFRENGTGVMIISNSITDTIYKCPKNYVFYHNKFIGEYGMNHITYEDLMLTVADSEKSVAEAIGKTD